MHYIPNFATIGSVRRDIMTQLKKITQKIEELRALMHQLMNEKESLTDPELVAFSQKLDDLLNEYDKLIEKS